MKTKKYFYVITVLMIFQTTLTGHVNLTKSQEFQSITSSDIRINSSPSTQAGSDSYIRITPDIFLAKLNDYSPVLAERASQAFKTDDRKEEIKILFGIREQLKPVFTHWNKLEKSQKLPLEKSYHALWVCLLNLRDPEIAKIVFEQYKSEIKEDGSHIPSTIYALLDTGYCSGVFYQSSEVFLEMRKELHQELAALLKNTKNAATINNCCHVMICAYDSVADPTVSEYMGRLLPDKQVVRQSELLDNPNCWDFFQGKRKALLLEPLTEHTAMGIILLQEVFYYKTIAEKIRKQKAEELAQGNTSNILALNYKMGHFLPRLSYLVEMEDVIQGKRMLRTGTHYSDEIKRMLDR